VARTQLSAVVPVFGCADCLPALHDRLGAGLAQVTGDYEIVLVDDRSPDGAWPLIQRLARADPRVRGVRLSRNFGQHAAITAGLAAARGEWVVVMDCDLQEPPELIPALHAKAQEGFDLVHTVRRRRQTAFRRAAGAAYFRLRNLLTGTPTGADHGTMSLLSRKVVDTFLRLQDAHREYLILLHWLGFEAATVEMEAADRHAGRSSYTLGRLLRVAVDGLFFQTTRLLRWIVGLGLLVALLGFGLAAFYVVQRLTNDTTPPGYTSLAVLLLVLSGVVLVSLGVVGLYVGKVFDQVKGRPLYVVDEEVGGP
jgi:polyisoprenyl-phosphate glycosyltransferase